MIQSLETWWLGLARRERAMTLGALAIVLLATLYVLAIEPARDTRARLKQEIPRLQEQLTRMQALRDEVRLLRKSGYGTQSMEDLQTAASQSLQRAGISARLRTEGERAIAVGITAVSAGTLLTWVEQFGREARVRVLHARVTRAASRGMVEAELVLEAPGS